MREKPNFCNKKKPTILLSQKKNKFFDRKKSLKSIF